MYFPKIKKGTALLVCFTILISTIAICLVLPTFAASDNLLDNASFEEATKVWSSAAKKYGPGFTDKIVGNGQDNLLSDGWYGHNYLNSDTSKRIYINHTSDAFDGNYALNVNIPFESSPLTIYPEAKTLKATAIESGFYSLTAWVKSTNTSSKSVMQVEYANGSKTEKLTQKITPGTTWHKIEIDGIYLESPDKNFSTFRSAGGIYILFIFAPDDSGETTYITIDNVCLKKSENMLSGGSFESTTALSEDPGYSDKTVAHGQSNLLVNGWYGHNYWKNDGSTSASLKPKIDHVKGDAVSGEHSLKIKLPADSGVKFNCYPKLDSLNTTDITEGYYSYSIWVKSNNNGNSYFEIKTTDGKVYKKFIPVTDTWQKVTINSIYLSDEVKIAEAEGVQAAGTGPYIMLKCFGDASKTSYIQIDDARLTRLDFLTNPDFEDGLSAWKPDNAGTNAIAEASAEASKGAGSVKITLSDENAKLTLKEVSLPREGFAEGYYMLAFDAKGTSALNVDANSTKYSAELTNEWKRFVVKDIDLKKGKISSMSFNAEGKGEVYIDNIEFYRQIGPGGLIDDMTVTQKDDKLIFPEVPEGYNLTILSSSNTNILALDGTFTCPEADTEIELVLKITNINDETDTAKTDPIELTVKPYDPSVEPPSGGDGGSGDDGGSTPPPQGPVEYFSDGELESMGDEVGYTVALAHTKNNLIADDWYIRAAGVNTGKSVDVTHIADGHSGYAVNILSEEGDSYANVFLNKSTFNTEDITEGYYTFSAWVRCNNNDKGKITVSAKYTDADGDTQEPKVSLPSGTGWQEVKITDIYLKDGAANLASYQNDVGYHILFAVPTNNSTYYTNVGTVNIAIDSITLTKQSQ